jgi:hypothetical protein
LLSIIDQDPRINPVEGQALLNWLAALYSRFPSHHNGQWRIPAGYFLRAFGLGAILAKLFRPQRHLKHVECKKVIIDQSLWVVLARCCVHIIPVLASITLITPNFVGYYMGAQLTGPSFLSDDVKLRLLQFVAKIHELLIIASTSTVVFSLLRHQLLFGSGYHLGWSDPE